MKRILALVIILSQLLALVGCNIESSSEGYRSESIVSEPSMQSGEFSQSPVEPISSIIENALSVEYKLNSEWIVEDIDSAEAKDFIKRLTDLFPEQFGEVASAYNPEDIVIRFNFTESTQHQIDVGSSSTSVKEVEISSIEIDSSGILFLLPQGTALAKIKDISTFLTTIN